MKKLEAFLLTGILSSKISAYSTDSLKEVLGEPEDVLKQFDVVPAKTLKTLYYPNVEISFIEDEFFQLAIYYREDEKYTEIANPQMQSSIPWYPLLDKMNFDDFLQFVKSKQIACYRVLIPPFEPHEVYVIAIAESDVWVSFHELPPHKIDSIHYNPSRKGSWQYLPVV